MKIPTITREAAIAVGERDGKLDAERFISEQPELLKAIYSFMAGHPESTKQIFCAGVNFGLLCLEEMKEPNR